jgi:hypothetical protein
MSTESVDKFWGKAADFASTPIKAAKAGVCPIFMQISYSPEFSNLFLRRAIKVKASGIKLA